ncbi:hypothetical protein Pmani_038472 [Petrolisthes manimaculis]|uniref:Uncharacterized protein n=1 Tax=Petrolisthes manimaculis TaxID=1843537 RepID=A0AAE1NF58_9EUCA|nr:hypothetical protein Pmani_038472 [Petrolisthes manimaculis]
MVGCDGEVWSDGEWGEERLEKDEMKMMLVNVVGTDSSDRLMWLVSDYDEKGLGIGEEEVVVVVVVVPVGC